jgi:hypothetical protein
MDDEKNKEKFYEFFKGNNYYAVLAPVIIVPIATNFLAYKKPMKSFYYLNIFIGLFLIGYAGYVLNEYHTIYNIIDSNAEILKAIGFSDEELQQQKDEYKKHIKSEIGNRCIFISVISVLLGLFSLIWNGKKILAQS